MIVKKGSGVFAVKPSHRSELRIREACNLAMLEKLKTRMAITIASKNKPIVSAATELEIESCLIQYKKRHMWAKWGMTELRKKGNMLLLEGPPGTGKTMIAAYMSKRIGKGMSTLNMKDFGGKEPGHGERMIADHFRAARSDGGKTIFMDEVEAIMWPRDRAESGEMWMVGIIDELLMQTAKYEHLIVAATNVPHMIDAAFKDRCFAVLQIGIPEREERIKIWKQKLPDQFPAKFTTVQIEKLAEYVITGRKIEDSIVREASMALVQDRLPNFAGMVDACQFYTKQ